MCGIVGYFGGAGNNLTRVLTAMSAMAYRAPDSTGVGVFGDEAESIRTRKSLGSVTELIEKLISEPIYPDTVGALMTLLGVDVGDISNPERQCRLLAFEGLPLPHLESWSNGARYYPSFDDLVDLDAANPVRLFPGCPGRPDPLPKREIRSLKAFKGLVINLMNEYDLSFLVIQAIIRRAVLNVMASRKSHGIDAADVLQAFDRLFEKTFLHVTRTESRRNKSGYAQQNHQADNALRRCLRQCVIEIPEDYDRDGVRCVFRLLDAALLSRCAHQPERFDRLHAHLLTQWPELKNAPTIDWITLYRAEKAMNVYGRAAAAALSFLQQEEFLVDLGKDEQSMGGDMVLGQTDPICLRYLSSPILAHGRWALQSPVTVENAHPLFDSGKQRINVLNGQFNGKVEADIREFLEQSGGYSFRSDNSSEYFSILWEYYFEQLSGEQWRYEAIRSQVESGLEPYGIGSHTIDYQIYQKVVGKCPADLDEQAFIEAARRMIREGGQVAVAGMSLESPRRLYVVSHNRPVFIVRRLENDDFMVVSDINAGLGLFPQSLIHDKTEELQKLKAQHIKRLKKIENNPKNKGRVNELKKAYSAAEEKILDAFRVAVYPLEGEEIFARITTQFGDQELRRIAVVTDFDGNPLPDIEPFETLLSPVQARKDLYESFFETHLHEIPERLEDIFRFYMPEEADIPQFRIREHQLRRRFGAGFEALKRIFIVGMGSAFHMGLQAIPFLRTLFPGMDVIVRRPTDIDPVPQTIIPENDLVILLSWSSTTGDMVRLAKSLAAYQTVMVAITEKPHADMALIAGKSGGVAPILSGEEVTVSGIKSTLCMLYCLYLFGIWLCAKRGHQGSITEILEKTQQLPGLISQVLASDTIDAFAETIARKYSQTDLCVMVDDLHVTGTGREAAFKLEENSWFAIGKLYDYQDICISALKRRKGQQLVLVNATQISKLKQSLRVMKQLYDSGIPFAAVGVANREEQEIKKFSRDQYLLLPKTEDIFQPFVDCALYYLLSYRYGQAHGRVPGEFPRNRVKSVTSAISRQSKIKSPAEELHDVESRDPILSQQFRDQPKSAWETHALYKQEKSYYSQMRLLAIMLQGDRRFIRSSPEHLDALASALLEDTSDIREIVFIPFDRPAEAAARNASDYWRRFFRCSFRMAYTVDCQAHIPEGAIFILTASETPSSDLLSDCVNPIRDRCLWVGPKISDTFETIFDRSYGSHTLRETFDECATESVYAGICTLFIDAWKRKAPMKAEILVHHFKQSGVIIDSVLNHAPLKTAVFDAIDANRSYHTAFFIGPPHGTGIAWVDRFDHTGYLSMEWHPYGESAHGPLVTVDPHVEQKFIQICPREVMVSIHGETSVEHWERRYLNGDSFDAFLKDPARHSRFQAESPFFGEGQWFLPELKPDYDTRHDNLIIIDATGRRYIDQALDELATFGCRYAQMVVISQEAFRNDSQKKAILDHPVSHLLLLPGVEGQKGPLPVSQLHLPFAMNLLSMAMAAASKQSTDDSP